MKKISNLIVLANANDITVDGLREMVRAVAQTDKRFLKKPEGANAVPAGIWVTDLIAPIKTGENWRAIICAADNKMYEVSLTFSGDTVTLGDDAREVVRTVGYQALANMADVVEVLALENALAPDADGWALLAPFGEHRKSRLVRKDGGIVRENYVQILDAASVDEVVANEKGTNIFQKLKRALVKRPIYRDHPDLKLYAPETLAAGNDKMIPLGVNDGCRKTARGLEFRPMLAPEGAEAIANDGCKFPSAVFLLKKTGVVRENGDIEVRPFALASVGLTADPNISGVDSLANANPNQHAANQTENKEQTDIMKQLLIGWLAANNVVLANDSTEQVVWDKFLAEMSTRSATNIALGNSKAQLDVVTGDKSKLATGAKLPADLVSAANEILALGNFKTEAETNRKKFLEARVDLHITQGKIAVADRQKEVNDLLALGNDKIEAALTALDGRPVKFAVNSNVDGNRKPSATDAGSAQQQILTLANSDPKYKSLDMIAAMKAIEKDHPALFEQLRAKPEGEKSTPATT